MGAATNMFLGFLVGFIVAFIVIVALQYYNRYSITHRDLPSSKEVKKYRNMISNLFKDDMQHLITDKNKLAKAMFFLERAAKTADKNTRSSKPPSKEEIQKSLSRVMSDTNSGVMLLTESLSPEAVAHMISTEGGCVPAGSYTKNVYNFQKVVIPTVLTWINSVMNNLPECGPQHYKALDKNWQHVLDMNNTIHYLMGPHSKVQHAAPPTQQKHNVVHMIPPTDRTTHEAISAQPSPPDHKSSKDKFSHYNYY